MGYYYRVLVIKLWPYPVGNYFIKNKNIRLIVSFLAKLSFDSQNYINKHRTLVAIKRSRIRSLFLCHVCLDYDIFQIINTSCEKFLFYK